MLLTLISTYMQNIIWILLVHNLFLAANVYKYTVRYAVRLPNCKRHLKKRTIALDPLPPQRTLCTLVKMMTIMDDPLV